MESENHSSNARTTAFQSEKNVHSVHTSTKYKANLTKINRLYLTSLYNQRQAMNLCSLMLQMSMDKPVARLPLIKKSGWRIRRETQNVSNFQYVQLKIEALWLLLTNKTTFSLPNKIKACCTLFFIEKVFIYYIFLNNIIPILR